MQLNETEMKNVLDQGMLTRSMIETETAMKKCALYQEMAKDPSVKGFFREQAKGLEDVMEHFRRGLSSIH